MFNYIFKKSSRRLPSKHGDVLVMKLGDEFPSTFKLGFLEDVMDLKATKDDQRNSNVIMFDGKKQNVAET